MAEKRSGAASAATETTPMNSGPTKSSEIADTLAQNSVLVKGRMRSEELRHLHFSCGVSPVEMVETVRKIHPKFDRAALSKAENADSYGIEISREAMKLLWQTYAPEEYAKRKRHQDGHRLTKRLACRVDDELYGLVIRQIEAENIDANTFLNNLIITFFYGTEEKQC